MAVRERRERRDHRPLVLVLLEVGDRDERGLLVTLGSCRPEGRRPDG